MSGALPKWWVWDKHFETYGDSKEFEAHAAKDAAELWGMATLLERGVEETTACVLKDGEHEWEEFCVELSIDCRARPVHEVDEDA